MLFVSVMLLFISVLLFVYLILIKFNQSAIEMDDRVEMLKKIDENQLEEEKNETIASVLTKSLGQMLIKFSPKVKYEKNKLLLQKSGILNDKTPEKYIVQKTMRTIVIAVIMALLFFALTNDITIVVLFVFMTVVIINVSNKFYISKKITKRSVEIIKSLPFTLDLITVSVEAGLSLDGAIGKIVSSIEGPLSYEFGVTLKEIRMGIEKKQALKNMASRVNIKDLSMLLSSLIQADELGVSLGKILRIEGAQLREKRRQAAREKAMKAPVKMLIPLMIFIFPTIFVIILAPAGIRMAEML